MTSSSQYFEYVCACLARDAGSATELVVAFAQESCCLSFLLCGVARRGAVVDSTLTVARLIACIKTG